MEAKPKQYTTIVVDNKPAPDNIPKVGSQDAIQTFQQQRAPPTAQSSPATVEASGQPTTPPAAQPTTTQPNTNNKPTKKSASPNLNIDRSHSASASRGHGKQTCTGGPARAATKVLAAHRQRRGGGARAHARLRTEIDIEQERFPFCLVWTPLPMVTWFLPMIGHTGISNSRGLISDFSDDYSVKVDNFSFGSPTKYYQFDPSEIDLQAAIVGGNADAQQHKYTDPNRVGVHFSANELTARAEGNKQANLERQAQIWDRAIREASEYYKRHKYDLYFRNCHQYIACVLNKCNYGHASDWSPNDVWWMITFMSSYTNAMGFVRQWAPFLAILVVVVVLLVVLF